VWAVPSTRDRVLLLDPASPSHRRMANLVRALDWLARFRIEWGRDGEPVTLLDRDRRAVQGGWAVCTVLSRLPLTAWFALPALLLPGAHRGVAQAGAAA
jgi:hypothetical protein